MNHTRFALRFSVLASAALAIVISAVVFGLLREMAVEADRVQTLNELLDKTRALHILAASIESDPPPDDLRQARDLLVSLERLSGGVSARGVREQVLLEQIRKGYRDFGRLLEQWSAPASSSSETRRERREIIGAQVGIKAQFISDDARQLGEISRARLGASRNRTASAVIVLIALLVLTISTLYIISIRGVLRAQRALRDSEQSLRTSEERLRLAVAASPMLLYTCDRELRYQWMANNPSRFAQLDVVGKRDDEMFPGGQVEELVAFKRHVVEAGVAARKVVEFRLDHGVEWWDVAAEPLRDEHGEVTGLTVSALDITASKLAEQEVRRSEQRIREIIRQFPAGVGVADAAGRWQLTNPLMDGYAPAAMPSTLPGQVPHWRAWDRRGRIIEPHDWPGQRALRGETVEPGLEMLRRTDDGSDIWMRVSAAPLRDDQGQIIGATCVVQNIDTLKRAEQALRTSEERFRLLVGIITDVPWTTDAAGAFVEPQPAWEAYTGQSWEQCRGFGWADALHPEDRERIRADWSAPAAATTRGESRGRLWHAATRQYRHFIARATALLNPDGSVRQWVGTCTDVHEQTLAEEALREADRRKNEFLATLAHELRNPLAPIRNAVHLLRLQGPAAPELQFARDVIDRQMQQMTRLIDDLMEVSRITQGKLELRRERVDLAKVIQGAVETSRPLIERPGHQLTVTLPAQPVYLDADLTRLAQVFSNLLNNAAKYTERGGTIALTAEVQRGTVVVSVKDSGVGIPGDKLNHVFDLFAQVEGTLERSQGGLGIGLSLARRLVEMHGGSIEARSAGRGLGSEFVVRLPVAEEHAGAPGDTSIDERAAMPASLRILIVDDNRDAADSLAMMLRPAGNDVRTAYDGEEALVIAQRFQPRVVLLDIGLPKCNGYEVCRRIRQQAWSAATVLIAVTGWGQQEDQRQAREAGFDRHLVKPVDPQQLLALLASLPATPEGPAAGGRQESEVRLA